MDFDVVNGFSSIFLFFFPVEESMESVDNPLHEAAKRGNVEFLKECLNNNVSIMLITCISFMCTTCPKKN